jgi:hypothetical protein
LADLAVERGDRGGVHDYAAFAVDLRRLGNSCSGKADDVERADQVGGDDRSGRVQRSRTVLAYGARGSATPRAVHRDAERPESARGVDRSQYRVGVGDVRRREHRTVPEVLGDRLAVGGRQIQDHHAGALGGQRAHGRQAQSGSAPGHQPDTLVNLHCSLLAHC